MKILKPLAIAALSLAMLAPAKAEKNYLGIVDYRLMDVPIACRKLDDAIEASKLDKKSTEVVYPEGVHPHVALVFRHQAGSTIQRTLLGNGPLEFSQRVPPKGDCRFARDHMNNLFKQTEVSLVTAVKVKLTAPNLPPGTIAICVINSYGVVPESLADCSDTAESVKLESGGLVTTYWIVTDPRLLLRTFDLKE